MRKKDVTSDFAERRDEALTLFLRHQEELTNYSFSFSGCFEDTKDALQETVLAILMRVDAQMPLPLNARSWLFRVTRNKSIDIVRVRQPKKWSKLCEECLVDIPDDDVFAPDNIAITNENIKAVKDVIQTLDDCDRLPLMLRYWEELSYEEIGEIFGLTKDGGKTRVTRARKALKDALTLTAPDYTPA